MQEPSELLALSSLLNVPICGTWSDQTLNKLRVGCQTCLFGLGWDFLVLVTNGKRVVLVMLAEMLML